jgi:hypothetical protein
MNSSPSYGMVHSVICTPGVSDTWPQRLTHIGPILSLGQIMSEGPQELSSITNVKVQVIVKILFFIFPSQNYA